MSRFTYDANIGEYGSPVRLSITFEVKNGLTQTDYQEVRAAFKVIEEMTYKYMDEAIGNDSELGL